MPVKLEICCGDINAAIKAQEVEAYRVELCRNLEVGGLTPSFEDIRYVRAQLDIKMNVLIRPRDGDFVYTANEINLMKDEIRFCGENKCDGVVIGILQNDGKIDKEHTSQLIKIARDYGMSVTFHRAFDRSANLFQACKDCIELGCDRILTSGGKESAFEGMFVLQKLIAEYGDKIIIMPGAGVTTNNISEITKTTACREIHGSFQGSKEKMHKAINSLKL